MKMLEVTVATTQLRARTTRPDGTPVVRTDVPYRLTELRAATLLALVFAGRPTQARPHTLIDGMTRGARDRVLGDLLDPADPDSPVTAEELADETGLLAVYQADAATVAAYRRVLVDTDLFPTDARREEMLTALRQAQEQAKTVEGRSAKAKIIQAARRAVRMPQVWAMHYNERTGRWEMQIEDPHYFDLEEGARCCALVLGNEPGRFGEATLRRVLQQAGRRRLLADPSQVPQEAVVAGWRKTLKALGAFELRETPAKRAARLRRTRG
jgi:hypothetical protein